MARPGAVEQAGGVPPGGRDEESGTANRPGRRTISPLVLLAAHTTKPNKANAPIAPATNEAQSPHPPFVKANTNPEIAQTSAVAANGFGTTVSSRK